MNVIETRNLIKRYSKITVLNRINIFIQQGDVILLVGQNGSGKSTMLKCILQHISYQGTITCLEKNIGYVPERVILPDYMTVSKFLYEIAKIKEVDINSVEPLLYRYQLVEKKNRPISALSKGMKQKLVIIQSLMGQPKLFLFDEPLNGLDDTSQTMFIKDIHNLLSQKATVIISTHSPEIYSFKDKRIFHFTQGVVNEV